MSERLVQLNSESKLQERPESVNGEAVLLAHILNHLSDAVLYILLDGTIAVCNPAASKLLKINEALLAKYSSLLPDDFFGFSMRESLKFGISHRLIYKNWMDKELEISSFFVYDGPKSQHGLLLFCRDLTEIKRLQLSLSRVDKIKELGAMTASIAHEIRNPLGGIRGFATLLHRDLVYYPHLQEMAGSIIEGAKTMERLVTNVLHFARPIEIQPRSVELGQFLKQLVKFVRVDAAFPNNVELMLHVPNSPILVPLDPDVLKSALLNLIFNAFQAMPHGGKLTIALTYKETSCSISLSDTGIGMTQEQMNSLYTPFFTTKKKGNGLGLVETKKIIQAHGGSIDVRSIEGKGTTFEIHLPLKRGLSS